MGYLVKKNKIYREDAKNAKFKYGVLKNAVFFKFTAERAKTAEKIFKKLSVLARSLL